MLSRTASCIFWMARYMERAENTARLIDVSHQMSLLPGAGNDELLTPPIRPAAKPRRFCMRWRWIRTTRPVSTTAFATPAKTHV